MNAKWQEQLERHRSERREAIIQGAGRLFIERGLSAVTLKDIVQDCGISKVTLYKYFESFDEIVFEVQMNVLKQYWLEIGSVPPQGPNGREKLRSLLERIAEVSNGQPGLLQFIAMFDAYYRNRYPTEALELRYRSFLRSGDHPLGGLLREGVADGSVRDDIGVEVLTYTVSNIANATLQRMIMRGSLLHQDQGVDPANVIAHMIEMIISYIKPQ